MAVSDVSSPESVVAAIREFQASGEADFLEKYGFGRARGYVLVFEGEPYPSKAILGAAHGYEHPALGPLSRTEFSGGAETTSKLEALGFEIRKLSDPPADASIWTVREGKRGEAEDFCLESGYCGVGWHELGDLSILGEERLEREIAVTYAEEGADTRTAIKQILADFLSIRPGDLVIMPLKTRRRKMAVGRVVGQYEYRPDFPDLARSAYRTEWIRDDVPRELFGDLLKWIDRPRTVSKVPVLPQLVEDMLVSGQTIRLPATIGQWGEVLQTILGQIESGASVEALRKTVGTDAETTLRTLIGDDWPLGHGVGMGTQAEVPWVGIYPKGQGATAQQGYYVVYLFAADGSAVYLALGHGVERLRGGMGPIRKRTLDLRSAAGLLGSPDPIDLRSSATRPRKYEATSAHAIRYAADAIPDEATLKADLDDFLGYLQMAADTGLLFDSEVEPLHLLFKWSADVEEQTLELHRAVAEAKGSVWWGKFGDGLNPIGAQKLKQITGQLANGIATYAFLYGGGETVRTRLEQITLDPDELDDERMPGYYGKDKCNLFVRLAFFEDLGGAWPLSHLVVASDPDPSKMQGALGNQTTPLFVFERFLGAAATTVTTTPELTMEWLGERTLWAKAELEELCDSLKERGQVILAGPPGTGKTWVAEHVARYLTQDQPLQIRTIQFHPSYGYEEFVEGLRPVAKDGGISFERTNGVILDMAEAMEGSDAIHVLIIDELNRANIPRVFGELLYLLEYRKKDIDLQYSRGFQLPENLKIIGTMNTADRSIRSIDVALRRRFEIFECPADADILQRYYDAGSRSSAIGNLVDGFRSLNTDLKQLLDRHHTIGQSFFMAESYTQAKLRRAWIRQIVPLIEDYFFDQQDIVEGFTQEKYWPGS